jgi:hypothetical protein
MESLSRAYVQAIAGKAGLNLGFDPGIRLNNQEFDYGVDGSFHPIKKVNNSLVNSGFPLEFQLKASMNWHIDGLYIIYDMEAQAYNKIADRNNEERAIPQILILLCLPSNFNDWVEINEEQLILRKCCYWERLKGDLTTNTSKVRIRIPKQQHLTTESLGTILDRIDRGDWR